MLIALMLKLYKKYSSALNNIKSGSVVVYTRITFLERVRIRSFCGPHFPVFGLNTDIYRVNLRILSKRRKMRSIC